MVRTIRRQRRDSVVRVSVAVILLLLLEFDNCVLCVSEELTETQFCQQYVRSKGYLCEEHKMYTDDGFELLLHRVGPNQASSRGFKESASNLKLALGGRGPRKHDSGLAPVVELADLELSLATFMDEFLLEGSRPYQLLMPQPDSTMSSASTSRWIGFDSEVSPENLPLYLPPYLVEDPISEESLSSPVAVPSRAPASSFPTSHAQPSSPSASYAPTMASLGTPTSVPSSWQLVAPSSDYPVQVPSTIDPIASPPYASPVNPISVPVGPELTPTSAFPTDIIPAPAAIEFHTNSPSPEVPNSPSSVPELTPAFPTRPPAQSPTPSSITEWAGRPSPVTFAPFAPIQVPSSSPSSQAIKGESVLLMHHELLNGDSWFKVVDDHGKTPLLPFILADSGLDVWIAHERATFWGHDHVEFQSSDQGYWNWTWDEYATHDVPSMLGYINEKTQSKIHLVGVSQSAAVGVAVATQPNVVPLLRSLILVGPTIYQGRAGSPLLQTWAGVFARISDGPAFSPISGQFNISRQFDIRSFSLGGPASMISGPDCCISSSVTLFDNGWDGTTSYKNLQHFEQGMLSNTFQHFDYGSPARNLEAYGEPIPPTYSPRKIPADVPVLVIYGGQDFFSPPEGIQELISEMQKPPVTVYLPLYAHFDLFFSSRRNEDVYQPIRSFLQGPGSGTVVPTAGQASREYLKT